MIAFFICLLIADFLTGLFHWIEDTYSTKNWPFNIGVHNIEHHKQPGLMGRMGTFITRNSIPCALALIGAPVLWFLGIPIMYVLMIAGLAALGNEVHAWNHRANNNLIITYLQEAGLVQTKQQHSKHHKYPYNVCYCTLTNLVNPIVDYFKVWAKMEAVLLKIGVKPKRLTEERDGY